MTSPEHRYVGRASVPTPTATTDSGSSDSGSTRGARIRNLLVGVATHVLVLVLGTVLGNYLPRITSQVEAKIGQGPLVLVAQDWPDYGCDQAMRGMPPGGPVAESFRSSDPTTALDDILASGAAAFGHGKISIRLITRDDTPAYVYRLEVAKFRESREHRPAWVVAVPPDCGGGIATRLFASDLARKGDVVDLGVVGEDVNPDTPTAPLGTNFTVAANDPAHLLVDIYACTGYFEFGLVIHYVFRGDRFTYAIGSATEPLRLIGTDVPVPRYTISEGDRRPRRDGLINGSDIECMPPKARSGG